MGRSNNPAEGAANNNGRSAERWRVTVRKVESYVLILTSQAAGANIRIMLSNKAAAAMLYDHAPGRIRPFQESDEGYRFRYFCGSDSTPYEQMMPKVLKPRFCGCGARMDLVNDVEGPYLRFSGSSKPHFGAQPREM